MKEAARSADEFLKNGLLLFTQWVQMACRSKTFKHAWTRLTRILFLHPNRCIGRCTHRFWRRDFGWRALEHDRAVLVGTPTYGKGSVQKIFTLDEATRLKLTVAEYFLAHDRKIDQIGITPDITLGFVDLNEHGLRYEYPENLPDNSWLPIVREAKGWNGQEKKPQDLTRVIARRGISAAEGASREELLHAMRLETERESNIQRGHLLSTLEEKESIGALGRARMFCPKSV